MKWIMRLAWVAAIGASVLGVILWWRHVPTPLWIGLWPLIWLFTAVSSQDHFNRALGVADLWRAECTRRGLALLRLKEHFNALYGKWG